MHQRGITACASASSLYDVVVIGGGIVGLATARELIRRNAGSVAIIEREARVGQHQTGHNSGVIHASLYYRVRSRVPAFGGRLDVTQLFLTTLRCGIILASNITVSDC
jgi:glycine/D-amino acid oxidase-like deaminating enzyme